MASTVAVQLSQQPRNLTQRIDQLGVVRTPFLHVEKGDKSNLLDGPPEGGDVGEIGLIPFSRHVGSEGDEMRQQAVIVEFQSGQTDLAPLFGLEDQLIDAIERAGCGVYDGHEIAMGGSDGRLYMYGPDADALLAVVEPILRTCPFMDGRLDFGGNFRV